MHRVNILRRSYKNSLVVTNLLRETERAIKAARWKFSCVKVSIHLIQSILVYSSVRALITYIASRICNKIRLYNIEVCISFGSTSICKSF